MIVLSQKEYNKLRRSIIKKMDNFLLDYDNFTKKTSPRNWRSAGELYQNIKNHKELIKSYEPLTYKDLESDFVRIEVSTPEELEEYQKQKKFNI